jgi:predicted secreted Zn-dependent protease
MHRNDLGQILVAAIILIICETSCAIANVVEARQMNFYSVTGTRPADVRAEMNRVRPKGYAARTIWHVDWRYTYRVVGGRCSIATVATNLSIASLYPRLFSNDPGLRRSFDFYMVKLRLHEEGHARNGEQIARRIDAGIAAMSAPNCVDLSRYANTFGDRIVKEGGVLDAAYDARTNHGATQGARWP